VGDGGSGCAVGLRRDVVLVLVEWVVELELMVQLGLMVKLAFMVEVGLIVELGLMVKLGFMVEVRLIVELGLMVELVEKNLRPLMLSVILRVSGLSRTRGADVEGKRAENVVAGGGGAGAADAAAAMRMAAMMEAFMFAGC